MVTISNVVKKILDKQIFLQEAIYQGIVSYNLLAKNLKPQIEKELGKKVTTSSVIMALRRNAERIEKLSSKPSFSYSIETIKTDIFYVVLEKKPSLNEKIQKIYPQIDFKKGGILNVIQGNFEVAIITNLKYKEELLDLLHDENILVTIDDLVSISLTYSKDFLFTPGILYDITRFMAWENINIIDIILTKTEMSYIVHREDLTRCYEILGRFAEHNKQSGKKLESSK